MNRRDVILTSAAGIAASVVAAGPAGATPFTVPLAPIEEFGPSIALWHIDQLLDGKNDDIVLSRDAFRLLYRNNLIDVTPGYYTDPGVERFYTCYGHKVRVPGSALA